MERSPMMIERKKGPEYNQNYQNQYLPEPLLNSFYKLGIRIVLTKILK